MDCLGCKLANHVLQTEVAYENGYITYDFFIEEETDIVQQATSLPITKHKLMEAIKGLD